MTKILFHDGIVSLPFGEYPLNDVRKQKEKYMSEIQHEINKRKYDFFNRRSKSCMQVLKIKNIKVET